MDLREPGREDAELVAELLNEHALALFGERDLTAGHVREWFELPDSWMWLAVDDGRPAGYADLSEEAGRWSIDLRSRDAAAARLLLAAAVERAGRGALVRSYCASEDALAAAAHEEAGFRVVRHSFQMRVEHEELPPAPRLPAGIAVRPMLAGEEARIHAAHMASFVDHWEFHFQEYGLWRRWHRDRETFDSALWFLALDGDEVAGLALAGPHHSLEPGFGWIEILGVVPPWRRRGLGEALLRHAFRQLYERGYPRVGLGVDGESTTGAVRLYERVGMQTVRRHDTWELRM